MRQVPHYYSVTYKVTMPLDLYLDLQLDTSNQPELRRVQFHVMRVVAADEADAMREFKARVRIGLDDEMKVLTVQRNEPYDYRNTKAAA